MKIGIDFGILTILIGYFGSSTSATGDSPDIFKKLSMRWEKNHISWLNLDENLLSTCPSENYFLPVCLDGVGVDNDNHLHQLHSAPNTVSCSKLICFPPENNVCRPTPADTLDYLPPSISSKVCEMNSNYQELLVSSTPSSSPLPPYYGMENGIPPEFSPIRKVNLLIHGTISSSDGDALCKPLSNVNIQYFHVDDDLFDLLSVKDESDLRKMSCLGTVTSNNNGQFTISTTVPPNYGPPRHINLIIKAPGYQVLVTRIYFSQDLRLQQLSRGGDVVLTGHETGVYESSYEYQTIDNSRPLLRKVLSLEPRVCDLTFVNDPTTGGRFEGHHSLILKPNLPDLSYIDVSGYWSEPDGSIIRIETSGHYFFATQYPHLRTWGTITGIIRNNAILGVNFRNTVVMNKTQDLTELDAMLLSESTTVLSSSQSIGEIRPMDPFNSNHVSTQIIWKSANNFETSWHQLPGPEGYRYLKLVITRVGTSELATAGSLVINEIEFYEGYLSQIEIPSKYSKLVSPRTPSPLKVLCSSFLNQEHHCYKAFDGDTASGSSWISRPVGDRRNEISQEAWILLDLGVGENSPTQLPDNYDLGRRVRPTALKIVCGVGTSLSGCPMTFSLFGSNQPYTNFELIMSHDSFDFNIADYAQGRMFHFYEETPNGRAVGHRCGSCDRSPQHMCAKNAFDNSCETAYCDKNGLCGEPDQCPPGQYISRSFVGDGHTHFACHFCPGGKYGNVSGLTSQFCTGECDEGCYCTPGSTKSCEYPCGGSAFYCPKGSSQPLVAGAGMKTVDAQLKNDENSSNVRVSVSPCSSGHYCRNGVEIPCPVGTFGIDHMLYSPTCSGYCQPGFYCPPGTISPLICPIGYYCPDGIQKFQCPPGSYGDIEGLRDRECSGKCQQGYFCPQGSQSSKQSLCPQGRFGDKTGLSSPLCSGPCSPGYYCPAGSVSSTSQPCGMNSFYCPEGSLEPTPVTRGYYSIGPSPTTRFDQLPCPMGFYCTEMGEINPCIPGSYGDSKGLFNTCTGFCEPGYFCPSNSTSSKSIPCPAGRYGNSVGLMNSNCTALCPIGHYCPEASISPLLCRAGIFGAYQGLKDHYCSPSCELGVCSDKDIDATICMEGFYCPPGSISPNQVECGGSNYYCPKGSAFPVPVDIGYFSTGGVSPNQRTSQQLCSLGSYCLNGTIFPCPPGVYGSTFGLTSPTCSGPCPKGYYCPLGTVNGTMNRCPGGRYGITTHLADPSCSGNCAAGYYCPEGSTSPHQIECGSYAGLENNVYCLPGSSTPLPVPNGYYSYGGNKTTRIGIQLCEAGTYCSNGTVYDCPAGRYGNSVGLSSSSCSGVCRSGYYCPLGSVRSNQVPCPKGRMGNKEGLTNAECGGPCQNPLEC